MRNADLGHPLDRILPLSTMCNSQARISAILLAGGIGSRMNQAVPKPFIPLIDKPIALHSFELLASHPAISEIIVVCGDAHHTRFPRLAHPVVKFAKPGFRRQDSVFNGLVLISEKADLVCIHDSARPLLFRSDLQNVLSEAEKCGAAALAVPVKQTIKQVDLDGFVTETLDRSFLWEAQTPQVIKPDLLKQGFRIAHEKDMTVTDDISLVELLGHPVKLVQGSYQNLKITTPEDLEIAKTYLLKCP